LLLSPVLVVVDASSRDGYLRACVRCSTNRLGMTLDTLQTSLTWVLAMIVCVRRKWFAGPGVLYLIERIMRVYRANRDVTLLSVRTQTDPFSAFLLLLAWSCRLSSFLSCPLALLSLSTTRAETCPNS
jgi:hypothetical protein